MVDSAQPSPNHACGSTQLTRTFTQDDVSIFAEVTGDKNPLHTSDPPLDLVKGPLQKILVEGKILVHGMLAASLFSTLFGTLLPGCVYRSQSLHFVKPIYIDDQVTATITVQHVKQSSRHGGVMVQCESKVKKPLQGDDDDNGTMVECITGEAFVWLPGGEKGD